MIHNHYFKQVLGLETIDVYRVLERFEVTDPCLQHAIKKLLVAGGRGAKSSDRDIQEAIDSLRRWQDMRKENEFIAKVSSFADLLQFIDQKEPAADIDDESLRQQLIQQNGEMAEEVYPAVDAAAEAANVCKNIGSQVIEFAPKPEKLSPELPPTDHLVDPSGKPSWNDAPVWAMWLTQDSSGAWVFWKNRPQIRGSVWVAAGFAQTFNSGELVGNWRDSLEEAPGRFVSGSKA